jgi:hypothetical protein
MTVITRSQLRSILRNRRSVNVRKFTFVLSNRRNEDTDSEYESDSDYESYSESEYIPSDDESTTTEVESESEAEPDSQSECESEPDSEYDPEPEIVEDMRYNVESLRDELAAAECMLRKWEEEQAIQNRDNWLCGRALLTLVITTAIFCVIDSMYPTHKFTNYYD